MVTCLFKTPFKLLKKRSFKNQIVSVALKRSYQVSKKASFVGQRSLNYLAYRNSKSLYRVSKNIRRLVYQKEKIPPLLLTRYAFVVLKKTSVYFFLEPAFEALRGSCQMYQKRSPYFKASPNQKPTLAEAMPPHCSRLYQPWREGVSALYPVDDDEHFYNDRQRRCDDGYHEKNT